MNEDNVNETLNDEEPVYLYPIRCPVCGVLMAQTVASIIDGWMCCRNKHKTIYRDGAVIRTTKYGFPVRHRA